MAVLPNNLHQYWGHRGYLATTSIEAITNILRSEILRNLNDNDVLKNPLELNSPEEINSDRRHQDRTPSHRHHIDSKNIRVILIFLSEKRSRINYYVKIPHQSIEEEKKESYSLIYN